ncbi:flagellar biosynthesis anti-sigma factor FlgM [Ferrimonas aestuarii]|uniref:Negative regulator of flagellin synthesis n=1 Tax=Ferrimonas aestuarii TaxID=2569539 RepID=A0A4U1BS75_9GAMM|nr:flagellar biosynthesis anti-sigma factor FlgM [Ferrimonas aestuarii]TKB58210.1 flagellar biosynthesis anti-sigma factor FlgM [Ferrimonas aestuarii]
MAIDINKYNAGATNLQPAKRQDVAQATHSKPQAKAARTGGDEVKLTAEAQQLQRAEKAMQATPEVDTAKVESLKKAIAEGQYHVDPDKLAKNLSKFESELTGRG